MISFSIFYIKNNIYKIAVEFHDPLSFLLPKFYKTKKQIYIYICNVLPLESVRIPNVISLYLKIKYMHKIPKIYMKYSFILLDQTLQLGKHHTIDPFIWKDATHVHLHLRWGNLPMS